MRRTTWVAALVAMALTGCSEPSQGASVAELTRSPGDAGIEPRAAEEEDDDVLYDPPDDLLPPPKPVGDEPVPITRLRR